jgi:hypothetical protein
MIRSKIYTSCAVVALLLAVNIACEDIPQRDYDDFKSRTENLRPEPQSESNSTLADLRGMWLLNARLSAGIDLGLRVEISSDTWPNELGETENHSFEAKIWLDRQDPSTETPLIVVSPIPMLNHEGRFILTADPLVLDPEVLNVTTAVEAIVNLESSTKSADEFCGVATGSVTIPLTLDLKGSTFGARRDDEGTLTLDQVPTKCFNEEAAGEEAAGEEAAGEEAAGEEAAGAEAPTRPELPPLARQDSAPADVSGHWLVNVKLPVPIPLKLWASLVYTPPNPNAEAEGAEGGIIDGTLRREADPIDAEPIIRFTSMVSADGVFEVWMPNFTLDGVVSVAGDLLIGGVLIPSSTEEDTLVWCGEAAGEARSPLMLDLAGTTLYAVPWEPGSPAPEGLLDACPPQE